MDERLRTAAREGNVSDLYSLIQEDGNVFAEIDKVEFISTPLHIAADAGCIDFAMEIMSLKPSFARKLNQGGLSPIHLALEKGHKELVLNLLENAKDLVRVKGKKGETPLHYVITREDNRELLPRFLEDCPESIRDLTTENQNALHIAVINNEEEALKILCKKLMKTDYCEDVMNQKDRNGDTALHIAARDNRRQMIKLLLKCKADKHATNLAGFTALKVANQLESTESIKILRGSFLPIVSTFKYKLEKQTLKQVRNASAVIFQGMDSISSDDRNALLVILALLLTVTFQAGISPPGSVWQGSDCSSNETPGSLSPHGSVSLADSSEDKKKTPGKSVMGQAEFLLFYIPTCAVFIVTFFLTLGLLKPFPRGFRTALQLLLSFLAICFFQSIHFLAPVGLAPKIIYVFSILILFLMTLMCISYRVSQISVLILGTWLFSRYDLFSYSLVDIIVGNILVVGWLLLFLYDKLWKGTAVGVGYLVVFNMFFHWPQSIQFESAVPLFVGLGCWLFLFLHDEFWRGSLFAVGFCVSFGVRYLDFIAPMIILGCWLFLSLCRFFIKRYNIRRYVTNVPSRCMRDE